jgi:DNA topoisomerase IB
MVFDYAAKGGLHRVETVRDGAVRTVVDGLRRRRDDNGELFAYKAGGHWCDVRSADVNDYLRETSDVDVTAKDFRTWHATVLMAATLARGAPPPAAVTARRRLVNAAYREVSDALGNTPAVCRKSYVDPKVVDLFHAGVTMPPVTGHRTPLRPGRRARRRARRPGAAERRAFARGVTSAALGKDRTWPSAGTSKLSSTALTWRPSRIPTGTGSATSPG